MNRQVQKLSLSKETLFNLQYGIQAQGEDDNPSGYTCGRLLTECGHTCQRTCPMTCQPCK